MESRRLKSYLWLSCSFVQIVSAGTPFLVMETTSESAISCYQRTDTIEEIYVEEDAEYGKIVYLLNVSSGLEYNSSLSSDSPYFEVINDNLQIRIEVRSSLHVGQSETLKIVFTSPDIDCGPLTVLTLILTVPETTIIQGGTVSKNITCLTGTVIDVINVTCDILEITNCQSVTCSVQDNNTFSVSDEVRIQATFDNSLRFENPYELTVECTEVGNNGSAPVEKQLYFEVTFQNLCPVDGKTASPTSQTGHTTSSLISNSVASSFASITQSNSSTDGTGCNINDSTLEGFVVGPSMVAILATIVALIGALTAAGCYCLGYKRCVPLPMGLCHREIKDEETDDAEPKTVTA